MTQNAWRGHVIPAVVFACRMSIVIFFLIVVSSYSISRSAYAQSRSNGRVNAEYLTRTNSVDITAALADEGVLTGKGIVIGIFDGGVNDDLSAFKENNKSRIVSQSCFDGSNELIGCNTQSNREAHVSCTSLEVGCFHGTSVAGFAAGNQSEVSIKGTKTGIGGIAQGAHINYIREAMDAEGTIEYNNFVSALELFLYQKTSGSLAAPDVVNLSLSFPRESYADCNADRAAKRAIDGLVNAGVVVVAASGNESDKSKISYPACLDNVIAVGSTTVDSNVEVVSDFSNSSAEVDLVAPGQDVLGLLPQDSRYAVVSGTSFAAPLVSGAVALIKQAKPELPPSEIRQLLINSGDDVSDPATGSHYRRLNVGRAVAAATQPAKKVVVEDHALTPTPEPAQAQGIDHVQYAPQTVIANTGSSTSFVEINEMLIAVTFAALVAMITHIVGSRRRLVLRNQVPEQ